MVRTIPYFMPFLGLLACGQAPISTPAGVNPVARDPLLLTPGDVVRVTVWRRPELSGEFLVAADSTFKHPVYQELKVAGLSVGEAKQRLETFLLKFLTTPQVSLEPLLQVTVGGEVRSPNLYRLPPETDVAQAVALAGGPSDRGRLDRVRLIRGGRESMLDLTRPLPAALETPIASGDRIFVGKRGAFFRDVLAPVASVTAALVSVAVLVFRN